MEPTFADLMAGAHHVVRELETEKGLRPSRGAVRDGRRIFRQMLDYRRNSQMTPAEAAVLQVALDLLWTHLRWLQSPGSMRVS